MAQHNAHGGGGGERGGERGGREVLPAHPIEIGNIYIHVHVHVYQLNTRTPSIYHVTEHKEC